MAVAYNGRGDWEAISEASVNRFVMYIGRASWSWSRGLVLRAVRSVACEDDSVDTSKPERTALQ